MKNILIILFISFCLLCCSVPFRIIKETDKFYPGVEATYTSQITIKHLYPFDMCEVYLQFVYIDSSNLEQYGLYFTYVGERWAFIESIKMLIDNSVYNYSPKSRTDRNVGGLWDVTEKMFIHIPKQIIIKMLRSKQFDIRIVGSKRSFDITSGENLINKMNLWYSSIKN